MSQDNSILNNNVYISSTSCQPITLDDYILQTASKYIDLSDALGAGGNTIARIDNIRVNGSKLIAGFRIHNIDPDIISHGSGNVKLVSAGLARENI